MSSFTKKYTDEEMTEALGVLLMAGERLETAVYCIFKPSGFFESNRNIVAGYAGITDRGRFLCCKYGIIGDENAAYNMEKIVGLKIRPIILGQKIVTIVFDGGRKQTVKFQLAPKVAGSKLPNQERNAKKMMEFLEDIQNRLI